MTVASPHRKRPSRYDEEVIAAGVEAMWPDIQACLGDDPPMDDAEIEDHKASLRRAFRWTDDAYKVARDLEGDGWDPDQDLVEALETGVWKLFCAEREATKAWVAAGGVAATLPIGTRVLHPSLKGHVGEILPSGEKFDPRLEGRYHVFCAPLGHVRGKDVERAMREHGSATLGTFLNAEEVEVVGPIDPPIDWTCPVKPIDGRTGATLPACGRPALKARRSPSGRVTVTCTHEHRHRSEAPR
jgi:hypothetical protein